MGKKPLNAPKTLEEFEKIRAGFESWLTQRGSDIRASSNEYEVLRFTTPGAVGVIYRDARNKITSFVNGAWEAFIAFRRGDGEWRANKPPKKLRAQSDHQVRRMLERDGDGCWYCGKPFGDGDFRMSREHLVSRTQGGPDNTHNMVLAHQRCNNDAGNMSVAEKVRFRENLRGISCVTC